MRSLLLVPLLPLAACWRDPHPERTAEAHAQLLAQAEQHATIDGRAFSLIGSCDELERSGECTEDWVADEHVTELRYDAWGRPTGDPIVGGSDRYRSPCEQRGGSFGKGLCPTDGALAQRVSGTSEARKNVVRIERWYSEQAVQRIERSCEQHPREDCTPVRTTR